MVSLLGLMEESTQVIIRMIANQVMECSSGLMVESTMDNERKENNMVKEYSTTQINKLAEKGSGKMEKELHGLMRYLKKKNRN